MGGGEVIININVKNLEMQRPVEKIKFCLQHAVFHSFQTVTHKAGFPNPLNPIQGGPELTIQGGQKRLRYIFWPYLLNGSSDLYEI